MHREQTRCTLWKVCYFGRVKAIRHVPQTVSTVFDITMALQPGFCVIWFDNRILCPECSRFYRNLGLSKIMAAIRLKLPVKVPGLAMRVVVFLQAPLLMLVCWNSTYS